MSEQSHVAAPVTAQAAGEAAQASGEAAPAAAPPAVSSAWRWPPSRAAGVALVTGLLVTSALALTSLLVYNRNERRLLNLRVRELNLVLAATAPSIQTPLASAAELANATGGNPEKFRAFMAAYVGAGRQFASASLWRLGTARPRPVAAIGAAPVLASVPDEARRVFGPTLRSGVLNLTGILGSAHPTLGFEFSPPGHRRGFAVYAENALPANRRSAIERNSAFSDLDYALYLGRSRRVSDLLVTNVRNLPVRGRQTSEVVPFGAGAFTLVVASKESLGGIFFRDLPWIIGIAGALVALAAAMLTDRLAQGRLRALQLAAVLDRVAAENRELYTEQRSISQTLQRALLPDKMPMLPGLQVSAMYVPAASGVDIGGDWYDVVGVDDRRVLVVIGDVSGHGLRAATTMALLRHAALAYVAQDSSPASVLARLSEFVNRSVHDYFATVLCALIDVGAHRLTVASAGHMAPLVLVDGQGDFLDLPVGAAIGVDRDSRAQYREATASVPPSATLIAFTDGLVERRGEVLDVGLARLRDLATQQPLALDDLVAKLARELTSEDHHDDTAIVGIRWQN
jgi:serine phosphatase RsbU (regulator of sigma subunit)